jgi:hypothetical protein
LARRTETVELVRGDADHARWEFEMLLRRDDDGLWDFGGPFVLGRRGERHLGLRWLRATGHGEHEVFRGAKLRLEDLDPRLVEEALQSRKKLVAELGLTDEKGYPRCASVRPPLVRWSIRRQSRT